MCTESCLNIASTCVCVFYYRNTTSQQYRTPPPHLNKIHSVQTIFLTLENKSKKFTFWSQLAQYSTSQNQRHFNHKQKNCRISAKTSEMIQKWILFVWVVTLYCLNYRESDCESHTTTEGYPCSSSYRPRVQAPQQYKGPILFLPFLHKVQLLWHMATFNANCLSICKCA